MGAQERQFSGRRCSGLRCVRALGTTLGEVLRKQLEVEKGEEPEQGGAGWGQEPETKEESEEETQTRRVSHASPSPSLRGLEEAWSGILYPHPW